MDHLLPLERTVRALQDQGLDAREIGRRIRRSPEHVNRIAQWSEIPRSGRVERKYPKALERRVLGMMDAGETPEAIAERFKRTSRWVRQTAGLAHYRLATDLLRSAAAEARTT